MFPFAAAVISAALVAGTAHAESVFVGDYEDPNHPGCARTVDSTLKIRGIDPVPFSRGAGCKAGISAKPWSISGKLKDERTLFINFDEKDGSGEAFDAAWNVTPPGILLPDGTLWRRVGAPRASPIPGDFDDSSHPGCRRRVLPSGEVQGEDPAGLLHPGDACRPGDATRPWTLAGTLVGDQMVIDFDPIDADKQGPILAIFDAKDRTLRTANGVWTQQPQQLP